ncbi:hypothetical protein MKEN_01268400 [Mycena kentingensis (nom. inval.)]|nr:hypothetical protein MKEN_01268400 [Mycena kentingensis (nom. inval.)]
MSSESPTTLSSDAATPNVASLQRRVSTTKETKHSTTALAPLRQTSPPESAAAPAELELEDDIAPEELAQRIGSLIDSLPPPAPTNDADIGAVNPDGPPLPSAIANDTRLIQLLTSERVMNGSMAGAQESVWAMLERIKHRTVELVHSATISGRKKAEASSPSPSPSPGADEDREDGGFMVYAPLQPTPESQVELAESEMVLEYFDEPETPAPTKTPTEELKPPPSPSSQPAAEGMTEGKKEEGSSLKPSRSWRRPRKVREHVHWVPSRTNLSLQVMWWGYRLYLPPPVIGILNDTHVSAARRGAMLITAIKWMLDKVPLMVLPPQVRPAMMLLKRLTPYLGYVGVFVTWSWKAIKDRDQGDGVVLTATWLLPVALLPTSLKPEDYCRPGELPPPKSESEAERSSGDEEGKKTKGKSDKSKNADSEGEEGDKSKSKGTLKKKKLI